MLHEAARTGQARSAAQLNAIRAEDLRIPITIVVQVHDEIFQAIAAILKCVAMLGSNVVSPFRRHFPVSSACLSGMTQDCAVARA
jgi:hypothetical protein